MTVVARTGSVSSVLSVISSSRLDGSTLLAGEHRADLVGKAQVDDVAAGDVDGNTGAEGRRPASGGDCARLISSTRASAAGSGPHARPAARSRPGPAGRAPDAASARAPRPSAPRPLRRRAAAGRRARSSSTLDRAPQLADEREPRRRVLVLLGPVDPGHVQLVSAAYIATSAWRMSVSASRPCSG